MFVPKVRGCLYPTCTGAIVRSHVYTADHEQDWQPYPVDLHFAICEDHACIHSVVVICLHTYIHRYLVNSTDVNTYIDEYIHI